MQLWDTRCSMQHIANTFAFVHMLIYWHSMTISTGQHPLCHFWSVHGSLQHAVLLRWAVHAAADYLISVHLVLWWSSRARLAVERGDLD